MSIMHNQKKKMSLPPLENSRMNNLTELGDHKEMPTSRGLSTLHDFEGYNNKTKGTTT